MSQALSELLTILKLEKIEEYIFRGGSQDLGLKQVFGGQIMGQALYAAKQTVPSDRFPNSFHSYFLRPGDSKKPIIYEVEILRDGNSFSSRRVKAIQHGKPIFFATISFQIKESGFEHQSPMPQVTAPDQLLNESQIIAQLADHIPAPVRHLFTCEKALEIRPVDFVNPLQGKVTAPTSYAWFRANGDIPNEQHTQQCLLAYASDFMFLPTALNPHGVGFLEPGIQIATIDHSMWFHRPFNLNDWLLYCVESTSASGGRGLVRGQFYNRDGILVASTTQEGVIRQHTR